MTNKLAVILGIVIVAALMVDYLAFGSEHFLFLGKKMFVLIDWLAFWR